ncbi:AIR synthase-related protein [Dictyoglomus thermophilum]|uniref:phosphoribosylformylglycinamidine cyclo-ligase n=1 Tax=Dictyoglomus thermophilum (strain ATCC 35947 / DSM 3960 / H-6-12) TaxID=309799 RepID=B5YCG1_DICT6|nr:AIR synthase-related protein [Dictyoglomus thermophilum]ACI18515.1 phosphoribosylformylglycinamidine cyclo-ligase [Dictyoglomus thermophilum H-6-12]
MVALESSGFHSNGYSLIRKILKDKEIDPTKDYGFGRPLVDLLLEPTRIYCHVVYPLIEKGLVKALSHVRGGGIVENTLRVTMGRGVKLFKEKIKTQEFMKFIIKEGNVSEEEAMRVFNMGVGMVITTNNEDRLLEELKNQNLDYDFYLVGKVV